MSSRERLTGDMGDSGNNVVESTSGAETDRVRFCDAPLVWEKKSDDEDSSLHQLSPYIGKLKPRIARDLVLEYSTPGGLIVDPFCGSGTIPLEAALLGRGVFAADDSPYACVLTKAKLMPPESEYAALKRLDRIMDSAFSRPAPDLRKIPLWVRRFFHPKTLKDAVRFADECIVRGDVFLLSCFLGVLHHQRPGFLSYPSSHLVPYLRDRSFPPSVYPEMYERRHILPRLRAKVVRAYAHSKTVKGKSPVLVRRSRIENLTFPGGVDAIITSPPYMNALDYQRDNRLRLWFLDRATGSYSPEPTNKRAAFVRMMRGLLNKAAVSLRRGGHLVLVVGETITRKRVTSHPSSTIFELASESPFVLVDAIQDRIPDLRRSRRDCRGTKTEHILVFRNGRDT